MAVVCILPAETALVPPKIEKFTTFVVTLAELLEVFGSPRKPDEDAEFTIAVPPAACTLATIVKLMPGSEGKTCSASNLPVTVPFVPTGGPVQEGLPK